MLIRIIPSLTSCLNFNLIYPNTSYKYANSDFQDLEASKLILT